MQLTSADPAVPLEGSPYDLRVSLGEKTTEFDRKAALESGDWGFVHSFTTGSAVDGPGMRVVAWLTSCQFRCAFCHNPDTWKLSNGIPVTLERAIEVVKQYRVGLATMKGGFTVSGGEPLMQHRFLMRLFQGVKAAGIHTALDTNGALGERLTDEDLKSIDLVMLGLKAVTPDLHKRLTGMDDAPTLAFARRLAALKHPAWIRFVVVPGFTDTMEEIGKVADLAAELGNIERIDLLPFHQLGKFKWEKLGMDYQLKDAVPPSSEFMEKAQERFRSVGVNVV